MRRAVVRRMSTRPLRDCVIRVCEVAFTKTKPRVRRVVLRFRWFFGPVFAFVVRVRTRPVHLVSGYLSSPVPGAVTVRGW